MGILNSFIEIAPLINQLTSSDFAISVCDLEKCLIYVPGEKLNHNIALNTPHVKGSASLRCIEEKQRILERVDNSIFGFPYIAIAIPIYEQGELVGSVCFSETVERQELLYEIAENLFIQMTQMQGLASNFYLSTSNLNSVIKDLNETAKYSFEKIEETDSILRFIQAVSKQTNYLGINAAIEASRVGTQGSGFTVVAQEIRGLATKTSNYVKNADTILKQINESTTDISKKLDILIQNSKEQVDSIEYIEEITNNLKNMAQKLKEQSQELN